jgi:glutamate racemase
MINNNPIGLFDSGIGGTSIWKEIHQLLPQENTIYLADSKNAPYGIKTRQEIIQLSCKNTELLLNHNCKTIVVACNTATTNAIKELRQKYDVPFIGIEPAIKPAALHSKTQKIGILATKGTLTSELFYQSVEKYKDMFESCFLCTNCVDVCPNDLPTDMIIEQVRSDIAKKYGIAWYKRAFFFLLRHRKIMDMMAKLGWVFQTCGIKIDAQKEKATFRINLPIQV